MNHAVIRFPRILSRWACLALLLLTVACSDSSAPGAGGAAAPAARKIKIELHSEFQLNLPVLGTTIRHIAERVETASGGNVRIELNEPGAVVPHLQTLDAVSAGKVDAGYSTSGYWAGKLPAAPLFASVPFGPEAGEYIAWMHHGNGLKLYQEMYDRAGFNVKVLICGVITPETSGWFARRIDGPDDLKGLKMRFFGLGGRVMEKLGVSVTLLSSAEIFQALEKGVIDATEYSLPTIDQKLGFHQIVKHNYFPGWHQQATFTEMLINRKKWDRMSPGQQALIEMACGDAIVHAMAEGEATQFAAMRRNETEHGVTMHYWSPQMLDLFRSTWEQVAKDECERDPFFRKVYEDLAAFRADYDLWERNAFLPRVGR
ncbi:MAG: C4-dicarboxylate ABC transporter [Phycisphaeraceae bacterium]|nr:C4-dicarboxylate ABC transporter [Phycisphaeraceae bacterium]